MTKTTKEFTTEELTAIYLAAGGKITVCPNGKKKNYSKKNTSTRSKKNLTYNTTSAPGLRSSNYNSVYNCPTPYNGVKMVVGKS